MLQDPGQALFSFINVLGCLLAMQFLHNYEPIDFTSSYRFLVNWSSADLALRCEIDCIHIWFQISKFLGIPLFAGA